MANLKKVRNNLLNQIQSEDVSQDLPKHNRFEVESVTYRVNNTCVYDRENNTISFYNTSRGDKNKIAASFGPEPTRLGIEWPATFPKELQDPYKAFVHIYQQSLIGRASPAYIVGTFFIGYVDENFEPIEPGEEHKYVEPLPQPTETGPCGAD